MKDTTKPMTLLRQRVLDTVPPAEGRRYSDGSFRASVDEADVVQLLGITRTAALRSLYWLNDQGIIRLDDAGYYRPAEGGTS